MGDPIGAAGSVVFGVINFFQTLVPYGFGLLLIPLGVLGVITLLVARNR
jgi:hypothetical protein